MPGHAQTDETKKKISDALKGRGNGGQDSSGVHRSKQAQALYNQFTQSQGRENNMKSSLEDMKKQLSSLKVSTGRHHKAEHAKMKAQKEKIHAAMKVLHERIKAEREKQKVLKQKAMQIKAVEKAQHQIENETKRIQKATLNLKKSDLLEAKAKDLILKSKKPDQKAKLQAALERIANARVQQEGVISKAQSTIGDQNKIIKSNGKIVKSVFNFSDEIAFNSHCELLSEKKKFSIWRSLSLQEQRVDFQALNQTYDDGEAELEDDLTTTVKENLNTNLVRIGNKIKAGDIAGIAAITLVSMNMLNAIINKHIKQSYEQGKKSAARELKVQKPVTPTLSTQLMNLDSSMIAEAMSNDIDLAAKQKAKDGLAKGVATAAIVSAVAAEAQDRASKLMVHVIGNVIGENVNKGRRLVFEDNSTMIQAYQRSEILDGRTCNICLSLDESIVLGDDPIAQLDEVHDNCRGIWVPILQGESFDEEDVGLPSEVEDSFDTIGGAPTVNAFKQLKKPITDSSANAQQEIERRLKTSGIIKRYGH